VPLVLLLIAGLLYASFGNVRHALLVMLNVPLRSSAASERSGYVGSR
jgi:Cu/Ag efflux pump CusA